MACKTFHKGKYYVTLKRGFEDNRKDITVTIDKIFENDSLRILLSDDDDPAFLCILMVTRGDYEDLKKQQGLLIDFDNFPSQLVRLLQQCASNNMFLILQQYNPINLALEIVEHNEFRRLVHLSLKASPATDTDIKQHMSETIIQLKKTLSTVKCTASSTESHLNEKIMNLERRQSELNQIISKMEEDKHRREVELQETMKQEKDKMTQEKNNWQMSHEVNTKMQISTYQETLNRKDKQIDELDIKCKLLQENVGHMEKQLSEKCNRLELLEKEVQKSHIEIATLNAKNTNLDRECQEKEIQLKQATARCTYLEKTINDKDDIIKDLHKNLAEVKREKVNLEELISRNEALVNKNDEAIRTTSEQLLKANQIIAKQNTDLVEMKEKIMCRTAIALEQEKVIENNTKEMEALKSEIQTTKQQLEKVEKELESLREKYDSNEKSLKDREDTIKNNNMVIQWLHKKLEGSSAPSSNLCTTDAHGAVSSTPYFLQRHNRTNSTQPSSDESINFYATSKLSDLESSPLQAVETNQKDGRSTKSGKPSNEENVSPVTKDDKKATTSTRSQGKENNVNLPRVDYREKKSGKGSTYRATPISAYFPR